MGTYPIAATELQRRLSLYREGLTSLEELQASVLQAAGSLVDAAEDHHRQLLLALESRLELIAFTTNADRIFASSLDVVSELERWAASYLRPSAP